MGNTKKTVKNFSTLDWVSVAMATPLSATNPMRLFDKISEATTEELDMPGAPPPPPILDVAAPTTPVDDSAVLKKKKHGRGSTVLTSPSGLSDTATTKPTLLGQ